MPVETVNKAVRYRDLTEKQVEQLAEMIARDNLPKVNEGFEEFEVPDTFYTRYGKRFLDIVISALALIVFSPVILVVLVATYFDVGRPVLFKQERIGKDGKTFTLVKPRNMTNERNENGVLLPAPERVTKWGRFVRKCSLDELLNFWSILKGDMSIIGPRPLPVFYSKVFSKRHNLRHKVRPGLECPLHEPSVGTTTWDARLENDIWYVQNINLKTDIKMLFFLFRDALWGQNRGSRADADVGGDFLGYSVDGKVMTSEHVPEKYYRELIEIGACT